VTAELDRIRSLHAGITKLGEWETTRANDVVIYDPNGFGAYRIIAHADDASDAAFIAAAPSMVTHLRNQRGIAGRTCGPHPCRDHWGGRMSDMADVIWEHLEHHGDEYDLDYSRSIRTLSDTLSAALSAAGFGPVQEAWAEAWAQGYDKGTDLAAWAIGNRPQSERPDTRNPYREDT
jgi:hypothetical protein